MDVQSFLMEMYVPQLVKIICKNIFAFGEYWRLSEGVVFHNTVCHRFHYAKALFQLHCIVYALIDLEI